MNITKGLKKEQFNIDYPDGNDDFKECLKIKEFWINLVYKIGDHDREILSLLYGRPKPISSTTSTQIEKHLKKMGFDYRKKTILNRLKQLSKWGFLKIHINGPWVIQTFNNKIFHSNILELIKSSHLHNKDLEKRKGRPKKYEVKNRILLILTEMEILLTATKIQKEYSIRYNKKIDRNTFVSYLEELEKEEYIESIIDYETKNYKRKLYKIK